MFSTFQIAQPISSLEAAISCPFATILCKDRRAISHCYCSTSLLDKGSISHRQAYAHKTEQVLLPHSSRESSHHDSHMLTARITIHQNIDLAPWEPRRFLATGPTTANTTTLHYTGKLHRRKKRHLLLNPYILILTELHSNS